LCLKAQFQLWGYQMNINKYLNLLFTICLLFLVNFANADNHEELSTIDDELPAIDPFSTGGMIGSSNNISDLDGEDQNNDVMNNIRLVATIIGSKDKIAVFVMANGRLIKLRQDEMINDNTTLTRIYDDWVFIEKDEDEYQVFMNNQIKAVE